MKRLLYILLVFVTLGSFWACKETAEENTEFENWEVRNETFMRDTLTYAKQQIALAKAQWGDAWEEHCDWRVYPSYLNTTGGITTWEDSIAVHIIEHGTGSGCPMYTDSVRVTYAGRVIPTKSYPAGYVFDHTGLSNNISDIMDTRYETPAIFRVSNLVEGFTTALLHMHIGDYWRTFIPSNMGYGDSGSSSIPGYSTLVFDMRLKAYYKPGTTPGNWN